MQNKDYVKPEDKESDALDWAEGVDDHSRLACQIKLNKAYQDATITFKGGE